MLCPKCKKNSSGTKTVLESRSIDYGKQVRRRRVCLYCGHRFTTHERIIGERKRTLTNHQIRAIYDSSEVFCPHDLALLFGVHISTIRAIKRRTEPYDSIIQTESIVFEYK